MNVQLSWEEQVDDLEQNHVIISSKNNEIQKIDLVNWFKKRNYYGSLVDMNKPVDPKKQVHSNHPFALFVKREIFLEEKNDNKYTMEKNVTRYLASTQMNTVMQKWMTLFPGKKSKFEFQNSEYAAVITYLESETRSRCIDQINLWYKENLKGMQQTISTIKIGKNSYIKLFFDEKTFDFHDDHFSDSVIEFEYELYTIPKVFNNNDFNQLDQKEIWGLPNFGVSMNSKKPFLAHKTMKVEVPDRIPIKQALLTKEVAEWLLSKNKFSVQRLGYETGMVPSSSEVPEGSFHVYVDGRENEIQGFENVPFSPAISVSIEWRNFLRLKEYNGSGLKEDQSIDSSAELQKHISYAFFHGQMNGQFLVNVPDIKARSFTAVMQALFLQSRQAFYDFIYKGTSITLRPIFAAVTIRLLEEQLLHLESVGIVRLAEAFNLRCSLMIALDDKGGMAMTDQLQPIMASIRHQLGEGEQTFCVNDTEFYFLVGQLAYYLVSRSKTATENKTGGLLEPFLRAKDAHQLKMRLEEAYSLYKYDIALGFHKFNRAFAMVMGYEPKRDRTNARDFLLAGIFADNMFYEKSK